MWVDQIMEEVEKIFATTIGVVISVLFGSKFSQIVSPDHGGVVIGFLIEGLAKCAVAVFSGVATYLAIYYVKKLLKHETK